MKFRRGVAVIAGLCALAWISTAAIGRISDGEWGGKAGEAGGAGARAAGLSATLASMMRDPLSIFAMRSPGERGLALLNSKPDRVRAAAEEPPTERVLSTIRERPPVASALDEFVLPADEILGGDLVQLAALAPQPEAVEAGLLPPLVVPGGGFWGGGGGDGGETGTQPGLPTPVPEPATWSMMILGFFAVGSLLRRRGRSGARSAA